MALMCGKGEKELPEPGSVTRIDCYAAVRFVSISPLAKQSEVWIIDIIAWRSGY